MKIKQAIENFFNSLVRREPTSKSRRSALTKLLATSGVVAMGASVSANAHKSADASEEKEERFPGDPPEHFIVYQFNHPEHEYHQHVLGSAGAMIGKYEDNVDIIIACFGQGIHILAKNPGRPVDDSIKKKVQSLAGQGVKFHACGRTLQSMNWTKEDIFPFAEMVDVGVADLMELQEQNYTYVSW